MNNKCDISKTKKHSILFLIFFLVVIFLYQFIFTFISVILIFIGTGTVSNAIIILITDLICFLPVLPQRKLNTKLFIIETVIFIIISIWYFKMFFSIVK
jgi:hypothetical protein